MKSWPNFGARGKRKGSINYINQKNKNTKHKRKIIMKSWPNLSVGRGRKRKYSMVLYQTPRPNSWGKL